MIFVFIFILSHLFFRLMFHDDYDFFFMESFISGKAFQRFGEDTWRKPLLMLVPSRVDQHRKYISILSPFFGAAELTTKLLLFLTADQCQDTLQHCVMSGWTSDIAFDSQLFFDLLLAPSKYSFFTLYSRLTPSLDDFSCPLGLFICQLCRQMQHLLWFTF